MVTRSVTGRVTQPTARRVTGDGVSAGSGAVSLLLDTYTGSAAAYSLRKIRTAYEGDCIRVRRSADNAESDIGFVDGLLDTAGLLTFCGAGNGRVAKWYNQGEDGGDVAQTTSESQPLIVIEGEVVSKNSKPAIAFDGTNDVLIGTTNLQSEAALMAVIGDYVSGLGIIAAIHLFNNGLEILGGPTRFFANNNDISTAIFANFIGVGSYDGTNSTFRVNGTTYTNTHTTESLSSTVINIGSRIGGGGAFSQCKIMEVVSWNVGQTANLAAIETAVNNYWGIIP